MVPETLIHFYHGIDAGLQDFAPLALQFSRKFGIEIGNRLHQAVDPDGIKIRRHVHPSATMELTETADRHVPQGRAFGILNQHHDGMHDQLFLACEIRILKQRSDPRVRVEEFLVELFPKSIIANPIETLPDLVHFLPPFLNA